MPTPFALNPSQRKEAARMYVEEMLSIQQISDHYGRSFCAVKNALLAEGVKLRGKVEGRALRYPAKPKKQRPPSSVFDLARHIGVMP